jgi:hypothetical protein
VNEAETRAEHIDPPDTRRKLLHLQHRGNVGVEELDQDRCL